jgi:hypothetical protein
VLLLVKVEGPPGSLCGPGGIPGENGRSAQSAAQVPQLTSLRAGLGLLQLATDRCSCLQGRVDPLLRRLKCRLKLTDLPPPPFVSSAF